MTASQPLAVIGMVLGAIGFSSALMSYTHQKNKEAVKQAKEELEVKVEPTQVLAQLTTIGHEEVAFFFGENGRRILRFNHKGIITIDGEEPNDDTEIYKALVDWFQRYGGKACQ